MQGHELILGDALNYTKQVPNLESTYSAQVIISFCSAILCQTGGTQVEGGNTGNYRFLNASLTKLAC